MSTPETRAPDGVEQEVRIAARPDTVFPFFTDPALMTQWMGVSATLDPRPGGEFHVNVTGTDLARGTYVAVEPPRRVVFTWGWESDTSPVPPGSSTVEVTLEPDGDGTLVRLVHRDLPEPAREPHGRGWAHYLERLTVAAPGGDAGPDPWANGDAAADPGD
jgi:uncharacterized protein YndB with AHSA1/START domain